MQYILLPIIHVGMKTKQKWKKKWFKENRGHSNRAYLSVGGQGHFSLWPLTSPCLGWKEKSLLPAVMG